MPLAYLLDGSPLCNRAVSKLLRYHTSATTALTMMTANPIIHSTVQRLRSVMGRVLACSSAKSSGAWGVKVGAGAGRGRTGGRFDNNGHVPRPAAPRPTDPPPLPPGPGPGRPGAAGRGAGAGAGAHYHPPVARSGAANAQGAGAGTLWRAGAHAQPGGIEVVIYPIGPLAHRLSAVLSI